MQNDLSCDVILHHAHYISFIFIQKENKQTAAVLRHWTENGWRCEALVRLGSHRQRAKPRRWQSQDNCDCNRSFMNPSFRSKKITPRLAFCVCVCINRITLVCCFALNFHNSAHLPQQPPAHPSWVQLWSPHSSRNKRRFQQRETGRQSSVTQASEHVSDRETEDLLSHGSVSISDGQLGLFSLR